MYTDAHYDDISNIEELSQNMRKILKGVDIIDDPKFEILDIMANLVGIALGLLTGVFGII